MTHMKPPQVKVCLKGMLIYRELNPTVKSGWFPLKVAMFLMNSKHNLHNVPELQNHHCNIFISFVVKIDDLKRKTKTNKQTNKLNKQVNILMVINFKLNLAKI